MDAHEPGTIPHPYWQVHDDSAEIIDAKLIEEVLVSIYVNAQELATIMCSPLDEEALALGFLHNEGVISSIDEIGLIQANTPRSTVDVFLTRTKFDRPRRMILTSGCGGGITLQFLTESYPALESQFQTSRDVVFRQMQALKGAAHLYNQVRGVHTSILCSEKKVLVTAEDVGRHNTIDKIAGKALQSGLMMDDHMLLTSGRVSSEMLNKARQMNIPLVASRTSPTSIAVRLAEAWNICLVGYVRRRSMRVYTHPERLGLTLVDEDKQPLQTQ